MMKRAVAMLIAAVLLLASPAAALAATPSSPATASSARLKGKPVTPELLDVQLWPEDVPGSMTIVVVAVVPDSAPLPASVAIPLPKGATVTWAGEIFEVAEQDVQRQPEVAPDKSSLTVTTEKSRVIQYEAQYKPYVDKGGRRYAELDWVQTDPADLVRFAFRMPVRTSDIKSRPGYSDMSGENTTGDKLFTLPDRKLKVGEAFKLAVDYVPSAAPQSSRRGPDVLIVVLVGMLVVVAAVLAVVVARTRRAV